MITWIRLHKAKILYIVLLMCIVGGSLLWFTDKKAKPRDEFAEQTAPAINTKNSVLITLPYRKDENKKTLFHYDNVEGRIQPVTLPVEDVSHITTSADGSTVLLESHGEHVGIFLYEPLGGKIRKLNLPEGASEPALSPVSPWVYYVHNGDLYSINITTSETHQLTTTPATESAPTVSNDGTRLVINAQDNQTKESTVFSINPETAQVIATRTLSAWSNAKAISPDNTRIYLGDEGRIADIETGNTLYTFRTQEETQTILGGGSWRTDGTLLYTEWTDAYAEVNIRYLSADYATDERYMVFAFSVPTEVVTQLPFSAQAHIAAIP
jgi:hypothetical protein